MRYSLKELNEGGDFFFLSLVATLRQRSSYSAGFCVCFKSATNEMNLWGVCKDIMIWQLGGQLIHEGRIILLLITTSK